MHRLPQLLLDHGMVCYGTRQGGKGRKRVVFVVREKNGRLHRAGTLAEAVAKAAKAVGLK